MNIDAHLICWNEAETIHLTIKYYQSFCRHIYLYDNFSDDGTREIAESLGAKVQLFGISGQLNDHEYLKVKNEVWKGSDADWVIVADCDEILYHQKLYFILKYTTGTIIKTQGFNIYSNQMPEKSFLEIQTGIIDDSYSKSICFKPSQISAIDYVYGCHVAKPKGNVVYSNEVVWLLHYRAIGGVDRMIDRHAKYRERLSPINLKWNLGSHYRQDDGQRRADFAERLEKSVTFSKAGIM